MWILNKNASIYARKSVHTLVNFDWFQDDDDWKFISLLIPATSWKKCMFKWLSLKKFSLMVFKWSKEESDLLANLVKYQFKWFVENWAKKTGKNFLKIFTSKMHPMKRYSELRNSADSIGTVMLTHWSRKAHGLLKRISSYWKAYLSWIAWRNGLKLPRTSKEGLRTLSKTDSLCFWKSRRRKLEKRTKNTW